MAFQFLKLQFLKSIRSVSLARNLIGGFFIGLLTLILLSYVSLLAFGLQELIEDGLGKENAITFLNANLIYFFIFEAMYRFFLQKLPVLELENFLHLPISRFKIIRFLLTRSFISPLSIIAPLLFTPTAVTEVSSVYGASAAWFWLSVIVLISWSLHWFMLWFKQKYGDNLIGILILFILFIISFGANYYGWFNVGNILNPFFSLALYSPVPMLFTAAGFISTYLLAYKYYTKHTYLEELSKDNNVRLVNNSIGFFSRFGLTGEMADAEWKLIIRHKKSRNYLIISVLILLYGLLFYNDPSLTTDQGFSYLFIFTGIFITGSFLLQYGQLFLSWNSASFDFFLSKRDGIKALIKGKYLLFAALSLLCFLLTVPYVYFGWDILFIHLATFLFNMGVTIHFVIYLALWKPKPMSLDKSAMFNYEGIGMAQFLMIIPMGVVPYLVFVPVALLINDYAGLVALGSIGILGMIFYEKLSEISVNSLLKYKYQISSTFREEL